MKPAHRSILVAEDSVVIQTVLRTMLTGWGYDVTVAPDGSGALSILQGDSAPGLAIVDWMMPGISGPELCRRVREAGREPYTYILLLTARSDSTDVVAGLDAGADDYLTKPFNAVELRARLRAGDRILDLQEQLLRARESIRERGARDELTGLLNRCSVYETLDRELARADRGSLPLSLVLVDIDRFRQINAGFGHLAGDAVLREIARRIQALAPPGAAGRCGGGKFLVVLPGQDVPEAQALADRIRMSAAAEPVRAGAASFPVTCSAGAAGRATPYSADAETMLRAAGDALLAARREARERIANPSISTPGGNHFRSREYKRR